MDNMSDEKVTFEQVLQEHGVLVCPFIGVSMQPMLRQKRDTVIIVPAENRLRRGDIAMYRYPSGKYVMHRVIRVRENDYVIRGDNLYRDEIGITDDMILGVVTGFIRRGRQHSVQSLRYRLFGQIWMALYPLRRFLHQLKGFLTEGLWVHLRLRREARMKK